MATALFLWNTIGHQEKEYPSPIIDRAKAISCVIMTYSLAQLELSALMKANFCNRDKELLRRTYLFQVNRVIVESSKALFGFGKDDEKHSYWHILESCCDLSSYMDDILIMQAGFIHLSEVASGYIDKRSRDVASHYDVDPLLIESELLSINDEDKVTKNACAYLKVVEQLASIIRRIVCRDEKEFCIQSFNSSYCPPLQQLAWDFESRILQSELPSAILYSYNMNSAHMSSILGQLHYKKILLNVLKDKGMPVSGNAPELVFYDYILRYACLIAFMQNDVLASAYAASTSSNSYECYIHLKRAYVSVYEVLNKICGFTERSRKDSLFFYLDSELAHVSPQVVCEYDELKEAFNEYMDGDGARYSDVSIRHSFAHYRNGKKKYVADGCMNLLNMRLMLELNSILSLTKAMNKLQSFLYHIAELYHGFSNKQYETKINEMLGSIKIALDNCNASQEIRSMVEKEMEKIAETIQGKTQQFNKR